MGPLSRPATGASIRAITARHSLLPTSQARRPVGPPHGGPTRGRLRVRGRSTGFPRSVQEAYEVRHLLSTGGKHHPRGGTVKAALCPTLPFWPEPHFLSSTPRGRRPDNHFGSFVIYGLYRRFTCVCHTHCLAVTQIVVPRRAALSRSPPRPPKRTSVLCPGRSLFRPVGSPGGTGGLRFYSFPEGRQLHWTASCRDNGLGVSRRTRPSRRRREGSGRIHPRVRPPRADRRSMKALAPPPSSALAPEHGNRRGGCRKRARELGPAIARSAVCGRIVGARLCEVEAPRGATCNSYPL